MRPLGAVLLGLALAVTAVCLPARPAQADGKQAALVAQLTGEDSTERLAAYRALNQDKSPALVPLLLAALPDSPDMGQYYGVMILQQIPDKQALNALRTLCKASSPHLRVVAAAALQRTGRREGAATIVKALQTDGLDPAQRAMLLARIYSIRDPAVQAAVRGLLAVDQPMAVLENAIYGVYLVRDALARAPLAALTRHEDAGARALAAGCLLVLGDAGQVQVLADAIASGGVRSQHLYKVKTFLAAAPPAPPAVLDALFQRLEEETDAYTLRSLVEILGEHGYAKAVPAIRAYLDDEDALLSKAAFSALARFPGALTAESMRKLLESGTDARKLAAVDALRRTDDFSGLPVAIQILREAERDPDRWEAASVLGKFRDAKAVEALLDALLDDHLSVRANAYNSLGAILRALFPYRRLDLAATGYVTTGPPAARAKAARSIRAWWNTHKDGSW